jgi:hypothetical protein
VYTVEQSISVCECLYITVFWGVTSYSLVQGNISVEPDPLIGRMQDFDFECEGGRFIPNVFTFPQHYTASQSSRHFKVFVTTTLATSNLLQFINVFVKSPRRPGFEVRVVHVELVVNRAEVVRFFRQYFAFPTSIIILLLRHCHPIT